MSSRRWRLIAASSNVGSRRLRPLVVAGGRLQAWLFDRTDGRLAKRFFGVPIFVVEVRGRKTGQLRRVPLLYVTHGDAYAVLAANGGNPQAPQWWRNLEAAGSATVILGGRRILVSVREADDAEREQLLPKLIANYPPVEQYTGYANRRIPIGILAPA